MKYLLIPPMLAMLASCQSESKNESDPGAGDSSTTAALNTTTHSNDSEEAIESPDDAEASANWIDITASIVQKQVDTSEYHLITISCAIRIESTRADLRAQERADSIVYAEEQIRMAGLTEEQRLQEDSIIQDANQIAGDDAVWYNYLEDMALEALDELKVRTITAKDKQYLKLVGEGGVSWVLDIRTNIYPGMVVLFNTKKPPRLIHLAEVKKNTASNYFLRD